jgi:hypothetical protein
MPSSLVITICISCIITLFLKIDLQNYLIYEVKTSCMFIHLFTQTLLISGFFSPHPHFQAIYSISQLFLPLLKSVSVGDNSVPFIVSFPYIKSLKHLLK